MTPATQLEVAGGSDPLLANSWSSFDKLTDVASYPMIIFHQRTLGLPRAAVLQRTIEFDADPSAMVPATFEALITVDNASGGALLATRESCSIMLRWKTDDEALAIISAETASEAEHWMQVLAAQHPKQHDTSHPVLRTWRVTDYGSPISTLGRIERSTMVGDRTQLSRCHGRRTLRAHGERTSGIGRTTADPLVRCSRHRQDVGDPQPGPRVERVV